MHKGKGVNAILDGEERWIDILGGETEIVIPRLINETRANYGDSLSQEQ